MASTLPPVTPERVMIATRRGLMNAPAAAIACRRANVSYHLACALLMKESGGRNIYGHDPGGALSTAGGPVTVAGRTYPKGADIPVTPANAAAFLIMIGAGAKSNGMGPSQITYAGELPDGRSGGMFRQMTDEGLLPWDPIDNMTFGLALFRGYVQTYGNVTDAGAHYNGGSNPGIRARQYGRDLAASDTEWAHAFGL